MHTPFKNVAVLCLLLLAGCAPSAGYVSSIYEKAINNPSRLSTDFKNDASRNPSQILPFTNIKEGDTVLEIGSGGGYTTELLSWMVGDTGKVYAHFLMNEERLKDNRLPNVITLRQGSLLNLETLLSEKRLNDNALDSVVIFFILHDIYLNKEMNEEFFITLYSALKPGGTVVVLDNAGPIGSKLETIGTLHRIDENFVVSEFERFGFVLDDKTDVLRNIEDDRTKPWGEFGGLQDRFAIRFSKAEN